MWIKNIFQGIKIHSNPCRRIPRSYFGIQSIRTKISSSYVFHRCVQSHDVTLCKMQRNTKRFCLWATNNNSLFSRWWTETHVNPLHTNSRREFVTLKLNKYAGYQCSFGHFSFIIYALKSWHFLWENLVRRCTPTRVCGCNKSSYN